jgi:hypothetical protein
MKRLFVLAISLILTAGMSLALPSGEYKFTGDGARGTANVNGDQFELGFGAEGCVGGVDGTLQPSGGTWIILAPTYDREVCQITISPYEDGYYIDGGPGCSYFSGAMCSMDGTLKPVGGAKMSTPAPQSETAVLAASFKNQSADFRKRMQTTLARQGHYKGAIDGVYGPGTEAAIKASATASGIDVTTNDGVAKILGALISGS